MKNQMTKFQPTHISIGYAYASSPRATQHGYGRTGCHYIVETDGKKENLLGVFASLESAKKSALSISLPLSTGSL